MDSSRPTKKRPAAGASDGAGDGIRTRDFQLGKLTLYQLSYARIRTPPRDTPFRGLGQVALSSRRRPAISAAKGMNSSSEATLSQRIGCTARNQVRWRFAYWRMAVAM